MPQNLNSNATLAENVFKQIKNAIVSGVIAPGSKIAEAELAKTYGVSRGPLREAIHRLEGQKLVQRSPHIGTHVTALSAKELIELYQIREALEAMAAKLAAQNMSAKEITKLYQLLELHKQDPNFQNGTNYYQQEGDFDFHYRIICASGNATLAHLFCDEMYQLLRMYRLQLAQTPKRPKQAFIEHERIVDALAAKDGELAAILMQRHIAASRHNIANYYQQLDLQKDKKPIKTKCYQS